MLVRVALVGNRLTGEIRLREGEGQANPEGEAVRGISSPTGNGDPGSDQAKWVTGRRKREIFGYNRGIRYRRKSAPKEQG